MAKYIRGLVSAIITTHNRKELLIKAIRSVLSQTYTNIECIVIDDASDDGTEEYISQFVSDGVSYRYIPKNETKGGNYARNLGILLARGEFIAFLDDDDEWLPTKIEKQVAQLSEKKGFVYCGRVFEYDGDINNISYEDIKNPKYKEGDLSREVLVHVIGVTSTILVRHSLIDDVGYFDEQLKAWQEYDLSIRLLQITEVALVRENLIIYRVQNKDKNRNTNNVLKWVESSDTVERKYADLFERLSKKDKARHKLYKCIDGYNRAKNSTNTSIKFRYLFKAIFDPRVLLVAIEKKLYPERGL